MKNSAEGSIVQYKHRRHAAVPVNNTPTYVLHKRMPVTFEIILSGDSLPFLNTYFLYSGIMSPF